MRTGKNMTEIACINQEEKTARLALRFEVTLPELNIICDRFKGIEINEQVSPGLKALNLVKLLKHVINLKMDKKEIDDGLDFIIQQEAPATDETKARLLKGLFLTFLEHKRGLPGLVSTLSGIGRAGFGYGKFNIEGFEQYFSISDIKKNLLPPDITTKAQAEFFNKHLTAETLAEFPNVRIGVYCLITASALIPFYAAALKHLETEPKDDLQILKNAIELTESRFSPDSEKLQRFISMNLFRVIFEELFNYESTIYSIFAKI
jgi:hypothetical protein